MLDKLRRRVERAAFFAKVVRSTKVLAPVRPGRFAHFVQAARQTPIGPHLAMMFHAAAHPDKEALVEYGERCVRRLTWGELDDTIKYVGFIDTQEAKRNFLGNARALLVPSLFDEPFGMVTIEAFACATPVIALDSGALPEVIDDGKTGYIVTKSHNDTDTVAELSDRLHQIEMIDRTVVHDVYEQRFTSKRMIEEYAHIHRSLIKI